MLQKNVTFESNTGQNNELPTHINSRAHSREANTRISLPIDTNEGDTLAQKRETRYAQTGQMTGTYCI
ncbi:MAG: hypothetical protein CL920_11170 [Deltaproteobacteria bacterium]|nr:hypothetical protein [Deltaproteobacteria bacterium]